MLTLALRRVSRSHLLLGLGLWLCSSGLWALDNQLRDHPSAYLALHGDDAVAWQDWGPAVLDYAREHDLLLLVSSGYFACHWCHVMQRESFQAETIGRLLNTRFVPVKLDRELHGALDARLFEFVERTQGQAGWPLNVFLTPDGHPLAGAGYLPAQAFERMLLRMDASWREDAAALRDLAQRGSTQMGRGISGRVATSSSHLGDAMLAQTFELADELAGGFGAPSKFPSESQLLVLLEIHADAPHARLGEFLQTTLDAMAAGGLRDHLAGGFFRYTVDPSWQLPHFEKMLYNQALLAEVYRQAAALFPEAGYAEVSRETLRFVAREMAAASGGYAASLSAVDGAGIEGGAYLWTEAALIDVLGEEDAALARRHWAMGGIPAMDGGHLPVQGEGSAALAADLGGSAIELAARIEKIRMRLLQAREQRGIPKDDKALAGWNGLMLGALAKAAESFGDPDLRVAAERAALYLRDHLWDGSRLRRALAGGREIGSASIEDYAYAAYGLDRFAKISDDPRDREIADRLLREAWALYHTADGWRLEEQSLLPGHSAVAAIRDGALPSPSAMLLGLAAASSDPRWQGLARDAARRGQGLVEQQPFWYAGHLLALMRSD